MTINGAIKLFYTFYGKAVVDTTIKKPIAWALYNTWKVVDKKEASREYSGVWIPIKTRLLTDEEREELKDRGTYLEAADWTYECKLPEDGETVLVTTYFGDVTTDIFCHDCDGVYFETYCDRQDLLAWMPMPDPYRG